MTLIIQKPTGAKLNLSKVYTPIDWEAADYARRVELADGQPLEDGVFNAINAFVLGCKADGIWSAIKASCILAGARTLQGALVPLVGTAPTSFNFVAGDYNRETGLVGNGSTKYLDSNRANNADPINNNHNSVWFSTVGTGSAIGPAGFDTNTNSISNAGIRNRSSGAALITAATGLVGSSRSSSASFSIRNGGSTTAANITSLNPTSAKLSIFRFDTGYGNHRLSFYSIGESLDLALLDTRVTDLVNAIGAAIP